MGLSQKIGRWVQSQVQSKIAQFMQYGIGSSAAKQDAIMQSAGRDQNGNPVVTPDNGVNTYQSIKFGNPQYIDAAIVLNSQTAVQVDERLYRQNQSGGGGIRILFGNHLQPSIEAIPQPPLFYIWDSEQDQQYFLDQTLPILQVQPDQLLNLPAPEPGLNWGLLVTNQPLLNPGFVGYLSPDGQNLLVISFGYQLGFVTVPGVTTQFVSVSAIRVSWTFFESINFQSNNAEPDPVKSRKIVFGSSTSNEVVVALDEIPEFPFPIPTAPASTTVYDGPPGGHDQECSCLSGDETVNFTYHQDTEFTVTSSDLEVTAGGLQQFFIGVPVVGWKNGVPSISFAGNYASTQFFEEILTTTVTTFVPATQVCGGGPCRAVPGFQLVTVTTGGTFPQWPTQGLFCIDGIENLSPLINFSTATDIDNNSIVNPLGFSFSATSILYPDGFIFKNGTDSCAFYFQNYVGSGPAQTHSWFVEYPLNVVVQNVPASEPLTSGSAPVTTNDLGNLYLPIFDETGFYSQFPAMRPFGFLPGGLPDCWVIDANGSLKILGNLPFDPVIAERNFGGWWMRATNFNPIGFLTNSSISNAGSGVKSKVQACYFSWKTDGGVPQWVKGTSLESNTTNMATFFWPPTDPASANHGLVRGLVQTSSAYVPASTPTLPVSRICDFVVLS